MVRRAVWAAGAVLVVVVGVSGCDSGGSMPPPMTQEGTRAPVTTEATVEEPTQEPALERPEVEPPERPAAMDTDDSTGAAAAVDYFLRLDDYLVATGDRRLWDGMSADSCGWCASYADLVIGIYEDGSWIEREPLIYDIASTPVGLPLPGNPTYLMHPVVEQPASTIRHPDGTSTDHQGATRVNTIEIRYVGGTFVVTGVSIEDLD